MTENPRRPGRPSGDAIDDDRLLLEVARVLRRRGGSSGRNE